jgi:hypothetical protein
LREYILGFSCITVSAVTGWIILHINPKDEFQFTLSMASFCYALSINTMLQAAYSEGRQFPKPLNYCLFPISTFDFIKLNVVYLLKRKLTILLIAMPILYCFVDIGSIYLNFFVIILSFIELLFILVFGSFIYHLWESKNKYQIFQTSTIYSMVLFYFASKFKTHWPLLVNPFGSFLFAPAVLMQESNGLIIGVLIVLSMLSFFTYFFIKSLRHWLI